MVAKPKPRPGDNAIKGPGCQLRSFPIFFRDVLVREERARCGVAVLEAELDARCSHLRRGWSWGTQVFAERMLKTFRPGAAKPKSPACARTAERRAHGWQQAGEWLRHGLAAAGLTPGTCPN